MTNNTLKTRLAAYRELDGKRTQGNWYKFNSITTASVMLENTTDEVVFWTEFDSSMVAEKEKHSNAQFIALAPAMAADLAQMEALVELMVNTAGIFSSPNQCYCDENHEDFTCSSCILESFLTTAKYMGFES